MLHYRYIGINLTLLDMTALGITVGGVFKVQVDSLGHPWSHGWHTEPREDWQELET